MKLVIFGTGQYWEVRQDFFMGHCIIAFLDNDSSKWGNYVNSVKIMPVERVSGLDFDKIVLMSNAVNEMKKQLMELHQIEENKIVTYEELCEQNDIYAIKTYVRKRDLAIKPKVLIAIGGMIYCGGSVVAYNTAKSFYQKGYEVVIYTQVNDDIFINELIAEGFTVVIDTLYWNKKTELNQEQINWLMQFEYVIVQCLQAVSLVEIFQRYTKVYWWIHEPQYAYNKYLDALELVKKWNRVQIMFVSTVAQKAFFTEKFEINSRIIPFGIPDTWNTGGVITRRKKIVMAMIASINENKGQLVFLQALMKLRRSHIERCEVLLIGAQGKNEYCRQVKALAASIQQVRLLGVLSKREIEKLENSIDVFAILSLQETMSVVAVEGMMNHGICIVSNSAGIAEYVQDGVNGFRCNPTDVNGISTRLDDIISKYDNYHVIRDNARKTYEKYFALENISKEIMDM